MLVLHHERIRIMRSLAVAMLIMGGAFILVAIGFLVRDASVASGLAILVPALSLVVAGIITLSHERQ
jgi:dipeptide/tripeptide permease